MDQAAIEIKRKIEGTRLRITEAVDELEKRAEKGRDLRMQARNYPLEAMLLAFSVGFIVMAAATRLVLGVFSFGAKKKRSPYKRTARMKPVILTIFQLIRPIITRVSVAATVTHMRKSRKSCENDSSKNRTEN